MAWKQCTRGIPLGHVQMRFQSQGFLAIGFFTADSVPCLAFQTSAQLGAAGCRDVITTNSLTATRHLHKNGATKMACPKALKNCVEV